MMRRTVLLASLCLAAPVVARAQTNETYNGTLTAMNGPGSVVYDPFHVYSAGSFSIFTIAPNQDAEIYLYSGLPVGGQLIGNTLLGNADDGCPLVTCGPSAYMPFGSTGNSLLSIFLGVGDYTVAFGNFYLSNEDAQTGENTGAAIGDGAPGDFQIGITSDDGVAENFGEYGAPTQVTPEPATMTLLATGLVGMAGLGRRRRKK